MKNFLDKETIKSFEKNVRKDKSTNSGRVFVAKNRNGPDGLIYPIYMNTGNVKIKVLPPTGETIADIAVNSAKKQEKILKDSYKEWKQDKKKKETNT